MIKNILSISLLLLITSWLASCSTQQGFNQNRLATPPTSNETPAVLAVSLNDPTLWQNNPATIWGTLTRVSLQQLDTTKTSDPNKSAWLKLASISKHYSTDTTQLVQQLIAWRSQNSNHPGNQLFPDNNILNSLLNNPSPTHIAILLPLQGQFGPMGRAARDGFLNAYFASGGKQTTSFYDTSKNNITDLYQQAIAKGADIVIGPLTKEHVQELLKHSKFTVPTLALNYTDIWFGSLPNNLYEFGLSPTAEAEQAADRAWQGGHSHALIIASKNVWTDNIVKTLSTRWQALGGTFTDTLSFTPQADLSHDIASLLHVNPEEDHDKMKKENNTTILHQQRRQDFDVIFLLTQPERAREIVPLLKYYYADNVPIYSTSVIYSGVPSPQKDSDLNGVIFCDTPWTLSGSSTSSQGRFFAVGRDAYLLSRELIRLSKLPNFPIYGATGALTLTSQQQIHRRLPWAKMHAGHP